MQFHYDGYVLGDPRVEEAQPRTSSGSMALPDTFDVLVVGAGPAGMITAAQLAQYPSISTYIIDRDLEALQLGRADGIHPRSLETFQAFGFAGRLIEEAYEEVEQTFWKPDPADPRRIIRHQRIRNDPRGVSEFPTLTVNEARVLAYFAESMLAAPTRMSVSYGYEFLDLTVEASRGDHPVHVRVLETDAAGAKRERTVATRYVVGCDGAHSAVRAAIGGHLTGSDAMHAWGVLDMLADSDFPDIRMTCTVQSDRHGNILHIPREGGYLLRTYVDLGDVTERNQHQVRHTSVEAMVELANQILAPYSIELKDIVWSTVYQVAHRLTDRFDDRSTGSDAVPHVFLTGDACHTHSAKAGQGMNVSMQDGFNLGWKLGSVLAGQSPEALLETYSDERRAAAVDLINFDKEWSSLMADTAEEADELVDYFVRSWEFRAGLSTRYRPSTLVGDGRHQELAGGYPLGERFRSELVVTVSDATVIQLGHGHRADGRWRLYAFADAPCGQGGLMADWCDWFVLADASPWRRSAVPGATSDAVFDCKVVYQQRYTEVDLSAAPELFRPRRGRFDVMDYERVYAAEEAHDIFETRQINRETGCVVVVRPDQYIGTILPFDVREEWIDYFDAVLTSRQWAAAPADQPRTV